MNYGDEYYDNRSFKIALFFGILIHISVLFFFIITVAWKPTIPPPLNPGIEINLGFQDLGKSTLQPNEVKKVDIKNESKTDEVVQNENEVLPELNENIEGNNDTEKNTEKNLNTVKETTEVKKSENTSKEILTNENETVPITTDNKNEQKRIEQKSEPLKSEPKKKKKVIEKVSRKKKPTPKPKVDKNLFFKKQNLKTKKTENNNISNNGDKGEKGEKTKSSVYGASLNLSGWEWDSPPLVYDESSDAGKIVFEITIDDFGAILKVVTIERTVTPNVERKYIDAVKKLTFHSVGVAGSDKNHVVGYITFILKSK